mmetsp:Transcript_25702/g.65304  ORF Transcript_25702/g.65304 Transcript_25702/m.65304 type:complete len:204 (-) Transcript_25702:2315-2926(-)
MRFLSSWAFCLSMCSLPSLTSSPAGTSWLQSSVNDSSRSTLNDCSSISSIALVSTPLFSLVTISTTPLMIMNTQCASSPSWNRYSPGMNSFSLSRARIIDTSEERSMAACASLRVISITLGGCSRLLRHGSGERQCSVVQGCCMMPSSVMRFSGSFSSIWMNRVCRSVLMRTSAGNLISSLRMALEMSSTHDPVKGRRPNTKQ